MWRWPQSRREIFDVYGCSCEYRETVMGGGLSGKRLSLTS